jgi:hypothetical protein
MGVQPGGVKMLLPPDSGLDEFPTTRKAGPLWRLFLARDPSTGDTRSPFWFASTSDDNPAVGGRYGLPEPYGTCYFAESPQGAWLEVFRTAMVAMRDLRRRRLCMATPPRPTTVADLASPLVRSFGITGEIHTCSDYTITRRWAAALHAKGLGGVVGKVRHDPALEELSVALFDEAGAHPPYGWEWDVTTTKPADDLDLIASMAVWGVRVADIPYDVPTVR